MILAFKKKIALALALVFMLQVFSSFFIYADFIINNEYIATVLCINKKKPEMHCDGKCYLKTQLGKEEKKKQSRENALKETNKVQFISEPFKTKLNTEVVLEISSKVKFNYKQISPQELAFSIFHPPQV